MTSKSIARARQALRTSTSMFRRKVDAALPIDLTKQGREKRREFAATLGSLADDEARLLAGDILIDELAKHHKRTKNTSTRHFLVTFCWDAGVLSIDQPHDLELKAKLDAMCLKVRKRMSKIGLQGIGVIEIVAVRGGQDMPPRLLAHIHLIQWTTDRQFRPKVAARSLMATGAFPNSFGAPGVTILSRKMAAINFRNKDSEAYDRLFADLHRDQTKSSLTWLGYYLLQAPAFVKQVCPVKGKPDKSVMRSNSTSYSPQLALALHCLLSSVPITDAIFSIGKEGQLVGGPWRKRFKAGLAKRHAREKARRGKASKAKVRHRRSRLLKRLRLEQRLEATLSARRHEIVNGVSPGRLWKSQ